MNMIKEIHSGHITGYVYESAKAMGQAAADYMEREIIKLLEEKEEVNLMFSVGISQDTFHKALCAKRSFDWNRVNLMLLDEKVGNRQEDFRSAPSRLIKYFRSAGTPFKNGYFFDGSNPDPQEECRRFSRVLNEHEPDLAFVESGDYQSKDEVPAYGLTITLPRLARMKRKFTIMPYPEKADSAYEVFRGEIRESLPATYVRMHDWTIFLDRDSAARIMD